jgi:hypothetical protein
MEPQAASGGKKRGNKLAQFVRKNKALSAVVAVVGGYFVYKELNKGNSEEVLEGSVVGEGSGTPNGNYTPLNPEEEVVAGEPGEPGEPGEEGPEGPPGEPAEKETPEGTVPNEVPAGNPSGEKPGLTVNGKFFQGATGKTIVGHGESAGNKKWIEYRIDFVGSSQRWHYFPSTGNWSKVTDSKEGPTGGGKPPAGGGNGGGAPPQHNPNHPNAVNTGNPCIGGGVGSHTAPSGYHLFCEIGWIWRDKDAAPKPKPGGGGGGGGGGSPAPAPPAAPNCPAGTVQNIQQNRAEVARLTGEIQSLRASKPKGWQANVDAKEANRRAAQGAVDRGKAQPGCGSV